MTKPKTTLVLIAFAWGLSFTNSICAQSVKPGEPVSFARDVLPILSKSCFACHGPDEVQRQSGLRLDIREDALASETIVPGKPKESSLVERINSDDEDFVMPPPSSEHQLTLDQKATLKDWIAQGATYETHWAFTKPVRPAVPKIDSLWPANEIDRFVLRALKEIKLAPNEPADRYTLVRRVYLDLIGIPPSIEQVDQFVAMADPLAYEKLVDELLASSQYGERWAQPWLDLARYSDTNGYEKDRERSIWPYRDWVIRTLNSDLPYDQFSVQQIAGDMMDSPSMDQTIATGFHRNTMLNEEGGIDPLEYRYLAMVDRVATTGTVWLGITTGCAQCHTHKYDPITHTDYYRMMALMNNADEPDYQIPDESRLADIQIAELESKRLQRALKSKFEASISDQWATIGKPESFLREQEKWLRKTRSVAVDWQTITPVEWATNLPKLEPMEDGSLFSSGDTTKRDEYTLKFDLVVGDDPLRAFRLEAMPDPRLPDGGPGRSYYEGRKGDFFVSEIAVMLDGEPVQFDSASHDFSGEDDNPKQHALNVFDADGSTGWQPGAHKSERLKLVMNLANPIKSSGRLEVRLLFERHYVASLGRFRFSTTTNVDARANRLDEVVEKLLAKSGGLQFGPNEVSQRDSFSLEQFNGQDAKRLEEAFLLGTPVLAKARAGIEAARAKVPRLDETMVMQERPADNPRSTFRHHRGEYLNPREPVEPGIPRMFVEDESGIAKLLKPSNRLEFANWLVSESNPLVARVAVDRAWRELFGYGLVRTNGDFGVQSEPPTHPELLDWLAVEFRDELKWSPKQLHRMIVLSSTYRQSSQVSSETFARDVENRWLARGPSFRVSGEMVRDIVLGATGSLSSKMFGPGVRPPQPASVTALAYGETGWTPATGPDRFRRSIYTFKKRTAGFAAYSVFDGTSGETCTAKRNRSNTPLQALTVLNDEMYLELAQRLAKKATEASVGSAEDRLTYVFRSFLTRPPSSDELNQLRGFYNAQLERLGKGELDPEKIGGESSTPVQAALAMVARVVMNLDETITKR